VVNRDASDEELISQFKKTAEQACFGELFSRYQSLVYGVCLKYLKDRDEAKDSVMQIFEKLQSSLKTQEINSFKSWLYVTSKNHCLMHLRAGKGKIKVEISSPFMENTLVLHLEDEPELDQNLAKLERCIQTLAEEQRVCVRLFYLDEKCYKEVSEFTGFEMNKVKSYIQNGKRNLKLCLESKA
jgi:RNA polymerase sigma factor, sigma-70 family